MRCHVGGEGTRYGSFSTWNLTGGGQHHAQRAQQATDESLRDVPNGLCRGGQRGISRLGQERLNL